MSGSSLHVVGVLVLGRRGGEAYVLICCYNISDLHGQKFDFGPTVLHAHLMGVNILAMSVLHQ